MEDEIHPALKNARAVANIIGTQIYTIKVYEQLGNLEAAESLKKQNIQLEGQVEKLIKIYHASQKAQ